MTPRMRARRREDGAAAVEFALVLMLLLVLVFGIIQYGLYFYATNAASSATREALRQSVVGDCTDAQLSTLVANQVGGAAESTPIVTRTYSGDPDTDPEVFVTVKVEFDAINIHFPFLPLPNGGKVTREADGRLEDTTDSDPAVCS